MSSSFAAVVICLLFFGAAVPATGEPILDGVVDPEYLIYGVTLDYQSYLPQGTAKLYVLDNTSVDSNYVWLAWVVGKTYNDISYGENKHYTWDGGHTFYDLWESDMQRIWIFNQCGEVVVDAGMDIIDGPGYTNTISGYDVDMDSIESVRYDINGGDWSKFDFDTSFAANLNDYGYWTNGTVDIEIDSPPWLDETNYVPVAAFSNWQFDLVWEMRLERSATITIDCPGGGVEAALILEPIELHASPNKGLVKGKVRPPIGYVPSALGDYVWLDVNRDGVQDAGEPGLANVTIDLYTDPNGDGDPSDGAVIYSTVTDGSGHYLFDALGSGNYVVQITDSNGVLSALTPTVPSTNELAVSLDVAERYMDADFGYADSAIIGDYVWSDADNDGIQDSGEVGIGGVTLGLYDATTTLVATTTTAPDGSYYFFNVTSGVYTVDVTDTNGVLSGYALTSGPQSSTDPSSSITVTADNAYLYVDFGYYQAGLGTIGNQVWLDTDQDGLFEAGEEGIENVTIDLIYDANSNGVQDAGDYVIATTATDTNGTYSFSGLDLDHGGGDANYLVHVTDVHYELALLYYRFYGTPGADDNGQADPYSVILSSGSATNLTADFAFGRSSAGANDGMVGDTVWYDVDGDSIQDPGEEGIAGVELEIWVLKNNGSRDFLLGTSSTDANGWYLFPGLDTGKDHEVAVTTNNFLPGGVLEGFEGTSQPDNTDETDASWGGPPNNVDLTLDFGYWFSNAVYSVGDLVWLDADSDGVKDPAEVGIEGVTVQLTDTNGTVLATTTTDTNGIYSFDNLADGTYAVVVTDTAGRLSGYTSTTGGDSQTHTVSGADNLTYDFGYAPGLPPTPTLVFLTGFGASVKNGWVVVEWDTASEIGTVGFHLQRRDPGTRDYRRVNEDLLLALPDSHQGGSYTYTDRNAVPGNTLTYKLVEVEAGGARRTYGPYDCEVPVGDAGFTLHDAAGDDFVRSPHPASAATLARLAARKTEMEVGPVSRATSSGGFQLYDQPAADSVRIGISRPGIYSLSRAGIAAALGLSEEAVSAMIAEERLCMTSQGRDVAWTPVPGAILFYGEGIESIYTEQNVYWLTEGDEAGCGLVMHTRGGEVPLPFEGDQHFTDTIHYEGDRYAPTALFDDPETDFLVWNYLDKRRKEVTFEFHLPDASDVSLDAAVEVELKGGTVDPDVFSNHHVSVFVNGAYVGERRWHGLDPFRPRLAFSQSHLVAGANELTLAWTKDEGVTSTRFYVDSFDVSYFRKYVAVDDQLIAGPGGNPVVTVRGYSTDGITVFDVTDACLPEFVPGFVDAAGGGYRVSFTPAGPGERYAVVGSAGVSAPDFVSPSFDAELKNSENRADWIVIVPGEFEPAAEALAAHRASHGFETLVVELESVYDTFNFGIVDPGAIRALLGYAYREWDKAPRYALLAGSGSFDYKDFTGASDCIIPPWMVRSPDGLFASDVPLGDVTGDSVPEIVIGRLPALTLSELSGMVAKILAHEAGEGWKQQVILACDDEDAGGKFHVNSEEMADIVPSEFGITRAYLSTAETAVARQTLIDGMNAGAGVVNYLGHSGITQMSGEGLLRRADVASLVNGTTPCAVLAMTCIMGRFGLPGYDCLAETLLTHEGGGAVAVWSPVATMWHRDSFRLDDGAFRSLFTEGTARIGDAALDAMADCAAAGRSRDVLWMYNLLGDPGTAFGHPGSPPRGVVMYEHMTYEEWRRLRFAPVELSHGMGDADADPDDDDVPNDLEFTLALDPRDGGSSSGFHVVRWAAARQSPSASRCLNASFVKRKIAGDPAFRLELCENLGTGDWYEFTGPVTVVERRDLGGGMEELVIEFVPPEDMAGKVFARLRLVVS